VGSPEQVVEVWVRPVPDEVVGIELLDAVETARLASFRDDSARRSYAAGHVLLRSALGEWLGEQPGSLAFDRTCASCGKQHGRPILLQDNGVHVSLSRTSTLVAVAATRVGPVGIDVEMVASSDFDGFAATALHPDERADVEVASHADRLHRRATSWARKEAALKALGVGLRTDPASVQTPPSGIRTEWDGFASPFTVVDLALDVAGAVGAVAVLGASGQLTVRAR
jgi:4'-phosphopantetheinyl transferase